MRFTLLNRTGSIWCSSAPFVHRHAGVWTASAVECGTLAARPVLYRHRSDAGGCGADGADTCRQACLPVYIHNCAGIMQSFDFFRGVAKNAFSFRNRIQMRPFIRQRIGRLLADPSWEGRVRLIDEESLRRQAGDFVSGQVLFKDPVFHPTRFSIGVARGRLYDVSVSAAFLATKKVVVCDLDDALSDGIIGEGPVEHSPIGKRFSRGSGTAAFCSRLSPKMTPRK